MTSKSDQNVFVKFASIALLAPLVILVIPFALAILIGLMIYGVLLTAIVWLVWCTRGVDTLVVYSDSPIWRDYMLENVIPCLRGRSVVLNWSERRHWRWYSLPVAVFHFFGGAREYAPIAVVFRPFRWPRTFRFWQPFRDRKHGDLFPLHGVEDRLYEYLGVDHPQTGG